MKLFNIILTMILMFSFSVSAEINALEQGIDLGDVESLKELTEIPTGELYETIIREINRDDRMDRCTSRLEREYPRTTLVSRQSICKKIFYNYDQKSVIRESLREKFSLTSSQAEKISQVKDERREKIELLSQERIEKISDLEARNIEKIATLSQERIEKISDLDRENLEKFSLLSRARINEISELSKDEISEILRSAQKKSIDVDDAGNKRSISEVERNKALNNYKSAKKDFEEFAKKYSQQKNEFLTLVKLEREACVNKDSEECEEAREDSIKKAKGFLESLARQQLSYIEQMRERVRSSESFTNNEEEDILEGLDESEAKITRALNFLETAETKSEIKEAADTLLKNWERIRVKVQDSREEIIYREGIKEMAYSEALEAKMARMLDRLEESEIDVSDYENQLESFSNMVLAANEKFVEGREKFEEFRSSENPNENLELLEEAKLLFNEAHSLLKEANSLLMDLVNTIYEEQNEEFADEDDEVEMIILKDTKLFESPSLDELEVEE